jgi:hypothetical protein
MKNIDSFWVRILLGGGIVLCLVFMMWLISGCAAAHFLVEKNPKASDLYVTDDEVQQMLDELSTTTPKDKDAVLYDETTDRYSVRPDAYKKALKDSVIKTLDEKHIDKVAGEMTPKTFWTEFKKDLIDIGIGAAIAVGILIWLGN